MAQQNALQTGFAAINGGRLYYEIAGDGPSLIFAHAGIADRRMWDDQFLVFAERYRVIRFDFWGFDRSTTASFPFYLHEDLVQLLRFLKVEQAHLIGCSLGGRVILDLALAHPERVKSLTLVGSGLSGYEFTGEGLTRFTEQIIAAREVGDAEREVELKLQLWIDGPSRTPDQVDPQVRERARQMLRDRHGAQVEGQSLEPPAIGRLSEIHVPTLILVGDRDETNIATIVDLLARNIPGSRKVVIPDSAHLPNMEKPDYFNGVVLEFLRGLEP